MDSSPKPSHDVEESEATLAEDVRQAVSETLQVAAPSLVTDLPDLAARFVASYRRVFNGVITLTVIEEPTQKQMGMLLGGFLMRCRELAARWRALEPALQVLRDQWTAPEDIRYPADLWRRLLSNDRLFPPYPEWGAEYMEWLQSRCSTLNIGWMAIHILTSEIRETQPTPVSLDRRVTLLLQIGEEFRAITLSALTGEDGLLKGLPKLQDEISGRIYREEFLGE